MKCITIPAAVAVLLALLVSGCTTELDSGVEIDTVDLSELCLRVVDVQTAHRYAMRKLKGADIELAGVRAQILRTEKSNPVVVAALMQGLQDGGGRYSTGEGDYYSSHGGDGPRLLAWANALLQNESIEARAQTLTWYAELRYAKEEYEAKLDLVEDYEEDIQRALSKMRAAGVREADCRSGGYW